MSAVMIIAIIGDYRAYLLWLLQTALYECYWRTSHGHQILRKIWCSV